MSTQPPGSNRSGGKRLSRVVKTLRQHREELTRRHVKRLWVFGSIARGEEQADSDVDLIVEVDPAAKMSLTGFAHLQLDLADLLGQKVDLAEWHTLRPRAAEEARKHAVSVF